MIKEYQYITIDEVLSRILRHPLLQDIDREQAVQYTVDFLYIFGIPNMFQDREDTVEIVDYRGLIPCEVISINQVKDCHTGLCLRGTTDTFMPKENHDVFYEEATFKTQGRVIFTSFKRGKVLVSYKSIPVDENGFPLLLDNAVFLKTLELYIKKEVFGIMFDMGKISQQSLQHTEQQYTWAAGQCQAEFALPDISEMEAISRSWNTLLQRTTSFDRGFKYSGNREYIRSH